MVVSDPHALGLHRHSGPSRRYCALAELSPRAAFDANSLAWNNGEAVSLRVDNRVSMACHWNHSLADSGSLDPPESSGPRRAEAGLGGFPFDRFVYARPDKSSG